MMRNEKRDNINMQRLSVIQDADSDEEENEEYYTKEEPYIRK